MRKVIESKNVHYNVDRIGKHVVVECTHCLWVTIVGENNGTSYLSRIYQDVKLAVRVVEVIEEHKHKKTDEIEYILTIEKDNFTIECSKCPMFLSQTAYDSLNILEADKWMKTHNAYHMNPED